jgi:hypothetical protein
MTRTVDAGFKFSSVVLVLIYTREYLERHPAFKALIKYIFVLKSPSPNFKKSIGTKGEAGFAHNCMVEFG